MSPRIPRKIPQGPCRQCEAVRRGEGTGKGEGGNIGRKPKLTGHQKREAIARAKVVYERDDGAGRGEWRGSAAQEVMIEAVTSKHPLKQCAADLDGANSQGYYLGLSENGTEEKLDIGTNGLARFKFYISVSDIPKTAQLRLRCEQEVSTWTTVNWPTFHAPAQSNR